MNELQVNKGNLFKVTDGQVLFPGYEKLKHDALELADNLRNIEVTEETLKVNKKLIAGVRKSSDILRKELSQVRANLLQPYNLLKNQVDEILDIVTESENTVRDQTKHFEEMEREIKQESVMKIFNNHLNQYPLVKKYMGDYTYFSNHRYLNKTYSMNKVEEDLVKELKSTETDLNVMVNEPDSVELITEYINSGSLAVAIEIVRNKQKIIEEVSGKTDKKIFNIQVFSKKDYELLKRYMEEMEIEYK